MTTSYWVIASRDTSLYVAMVLFHSGIGVTRWLSKNIEESGNAPLIRAMVEARRAGTRIRERSPGSPPESWMQLVYADVPEEALQWESAEGVEQFLSVMGRVPNSDDFVAQLHAVEIQEDAR